MKNIFFGLTIGLLALSVQSFAQGWETISPELKTLYDEANKAIQRKEYDKAVTIYHQAIRLQPNNVVLRRDLAYTHYLAGQFSEGLEVLKPVMQSDNTDPETYQLASALENANGNKKRAAKLIDEGLKMHPGSGLLLYSKGNLILGAGGKNANKDALKLFTNGIKSEPSYANNYLSASKVLIEMNEHVWAAIYAEIYINLDPESMKTNEGKRTLISAYTSLFSSQKSSDLPSFQSQKNKKSPKFADAVNDIFVNNFVTVADGLTVENLIMLRTRFILDWFTKYPLADHSLFEYHDYMIKSGYFDAYNQFLFGAITDSQNFSNWVKNNAGEFQAFGNYFRNKLYRPKTTDPQF